MHAYEAYVRKAFIFALLILTNFLTWRTVQWANEPEDRCRLQCGNDIFSTEDHFRTVESDELLVPHCKQYTTTKGKHIYVWRLY